ncbi:MAG: hypothetical protein RLN86_03025 [Cyclobacteriaceae bacterium]
MSRIVLISVAIVFGGVTSAFSQDREEGTERQRGSFAIYPAFGYQPETSVQLGIVGVWALKSKDQSQTTFERQSSLTPFALYTFRNQILSAVDMDYYFEKGYNLTLTTRFFNFPDFYFGLGNDNDPDVKESYTNLFGQIEGQFYIPIKSKAFLGAAFDFHLTDLRDKVEGGLLESDNVTGIDGGNIFGIGPAFKFETRDNVIYPAKGYFIAAQSLFNGLGDFEYNTYSLDFRKYFSTKDEKHIFAWQVNTRFSSGSEMPFYKLPQLGGDNRLRGIANASLYRDRQALFTQLEYRRHLVWRLGMVAFAGAGDVANNMSDFEISEFKYVVGTGLRFAVLPEQKLNLRFDFGVARGGQTGFYIGMREAF